MPTTPEKKFFAFGAATYALVKGKRWYVEHYHLCADGVTTLRRRHYGQINRIKCLQAREAAATQLMERLAGPQLPQAATSVLEQALHDARGHYRYKSRKSYESRIKYWRQWLGAVPDSKATGEHARRFIDWQATRRSRATVRSYQRTLHGLYARAGFAEDANPFHGIKTAAPGSKGLKPFTDEQCSAILAATGANERLRIGIMLIFYCFIRPGEIRGLRVEDVNLQSAQIEIRSDISKNKKTQQVTIPDAFMPMLRRWIGLRVAGWLLPNPRKGGQLPKDWLYKAHKAILTDLEITGRYSLYSWKHTGVVKAVKAGINLKYLQLQLRHHSLDQLNEYLKDLGLLDCGDLRTAFPAINPQNSN